MAGKSPGTGSDEQRAALGVLASSRDRGEADRARAVLLTLAGWTSPKIAEAFGVREDTVRLWSSDFAAGCGEGLRGRVSAVPPGVKITAALGGVGPLRQDRVGARPIGKTPRLQAEIEAREGLSIS